MKKKYIIVSICLIALLYWALESADWSVVNLWLTPSQQGQRLSDNGNYTEAAEQFIDPMRRGVALFRAGDFEAAAAAFGQNDTDVALFNRGNALVMLGKYDDAIASYEYALERRPRWKEALANLEIARIRKAKMATPEDDHGGTGGKLGADEIVFDNKGQNSSSDQKETVSGGDALSDEEIRALWLRRVQTEPADFLRVKFAYQHSKQQENIE